jgi:hypothetical protein
MAESLLGYQVEDGVVVKPRPFGAKGRELWEVARASPP